MANSFIIKCNTENIIKEINKPTIILSTIEITLDLMIIIIDNNNSAIVHNIIAIDDNVLKKSRKDDILFPSKILSKSIKFIILYKK